MKNLVFSIFQLVFIFQVFGISSSNASSRLEKNENQIISTVYQITDSFSHQTIHSKVNHKQSQDEALLEDFQEEEEDKSDKKQIEFFLIAPSNYFTSFSQLSTDDEVDHTGEFVSQNKAHTASKFILFQVFRI